MTRELAPKFHNLLGIILTIFECATIFANIFVAALYLSIFIYIGESNTDLLLLAICSNLGLYVAWYTGNSCFLEKNNPKFVG